IKRTILACAGVGFVCLTGLLLPGAAGALQQAPPPLSPTRPNRSPRDAQYVGRSVCAGCHVGPAEAHQGSGMARAMQLAESAEILQANPKLTFRSGRFTYRLERRGAETIYSVTDEI